MFEIRIICAPTDTYPVVAALDRAFDAGTITVDPGRDGNHISLRADHRPENRPAPESWPTAEEACANAPSILDEIGWTARTLAALECFTALDRDFYLRKAALLDRMALADPADTDATETAEAAALYLLETDGPAVICDPRAYVRQQYARTLIDHQ
ncbi:hypothetical protein ACGFZG_35380 [Streptomyces antibioticus]|uniref:hypothetical protein n=1 Tax=Streptomyces antibioticus TaxID=1890 RepID=UPI0037227A10